MSNTLNVAEAKKRLSELMSRVAYKGERFVIQRRGKPMVALVSPEDLQRLGVQQEAPRGLLAALGAWGDVPDKDIEQVIADIYKAREKDTGRPVQLES